MTKKILSTVAAVAVLGGSAMAFDVFDDGVIGNGLGYRWDGNLSNNHAGDIYPSAVADHNFTIAGQKQQGDALIFPAYFVGNGWQTTLRVINTSSKRAVVAKVVLYAGNDSHEVRDFNIYLSANDEWTGTIKMDSDGNARLISTDDSSPIPGGKMASATNPMKSEPINVKSGYVEVIGCAATVEKETAHGDHPGLRAAYQSAAKKARGIDDNQVFTNGVITSGADVPGVGVEVNESVKTVSADGYNFTYVPNVLIGDVRITDTVNGKDMDMQAIRLQNVTDKNATYANGDHGPMALFYIEGEAANIADRALVGVNDTRKDANKSEYNYTRLKTDAEVFNTKDVWMTYGDAKNSLDNQLILTSPYKRLLVNADANITNTGSTPAPVTSISGTQRSSLIAGVYEGVKSANGRISDYGSFKAVAKIYDKSENMAQASQFSPANTPIMNFHYEVSATEGNKAETDNLSYYLKQAQSQGNFNKGYALIQFTNAPIPVIATQMIATEAGGRVVTNWIIPGQD